MCFIEGSWAVSMGLTGRSFSDWICQELNRTSITIITLNAGDYPAFCSGNGLRLSDFMTCPFHGCLSRRQIHYEWKAIHPFRFTGGNHANWSELKHDGDMFWWCVAILYVSPIYPSFLPVYLQPWWFLLFSWFHLWRVLDWFSVLYLNLYFSDFSLFLDLLCSDRNAFNFECFHSFNVQWCFKTGPNRA